ncbi:hypothetical protein Ccrd_014325 [Cynara cardunculus var. scolymus]|uniref:Uncharacterized protein n=1 Tax=Cynara cardunculus var. scolymus TaxID=59895 RepID=A0A118K4B2_CYNCS|nr:hypothetical protein Ccrd_014325 [Cynara cardunculus var. scolymus]
MNRSDRNFEGIARQPEAEGKIRAKVRLLDVRLAGDINISIAGRWWWFMLKFHRCRFRRSISTLCFTSRWFPWIPGWWLTVVFPIHSTAVSFVGERLHS